MRFLATDEHGYRLDSDSVILSDAKNLLFSVTDSPARPAPGSYILHVPVRYIVKPSNFAEYTEFPHHINIGGGSHPVI